MMHRAAPEWLTQWEYAHRGLHSPGVPENSIAAAEAAIASGLGIECDVQMSRDNIAMVFHDAELDRLTGERGRVFLRTAAELEAITLGTTGQRIGRLCDFLDYVAGRVPVLVEIKSPPDFAIETCVVVSQALAAYRGEHAIMSFDPRVLKWYAKHSPRCGRGLVATDTLDHGFKSTWRHPHALEAAVPDFLACDLRDLPNAIADLWRETGRPVLSWTVRTRQLRERALLHADALISEGDGLA